MGAKNVEYQINTSEDRRLFASSEDRRLFVSSVGREILVILPPDGRLGSREVTTSWREILVILPPGRSHTEEST
jgi:hypothetical protein